MGGRKEKFLAIAGIWVKTSVMIITEQKELDSLCQTLAGEDFITIDTEFIRDKTYYPRLCLIQLGDKTKNAWAIDPLADDIDLAPLLALLQDASVLKVFHAARQDLEIFFHLNEKVVTPFFDTQVAAMVCGYGDQVGYENLVRDITGVQIDKASQFTDWAQRPLSEKQVAYALADVTHLVDVYKALSKRLEEQGRTSWVYEEVEILEDPATYRVDFDTIWQRVKIRSPKPQVLAVLRELAAWREGRAQKKDLPRSWVLKDDTLADIAHQKPASKEDLKKIRGFPKELVDHKVGDKVLKAVAKGLESDPANYPSVEKKKPPSPDMAACAEVLKMLLKIQATEHNVAPKLIAGKDDLVTIAAENEPDLPAMKGWRFEVFGRFAKDIKEGRLAIGFQKGKIKKFKVG